MNSRSRLRSRLHLCVLVGLSFGATAIYMFWARSPFCFTSLVSAARAGDVARVAREISCGAELDHRTSVWGAPNFTGWTALMWASYGNHAATVQLLVNAGADTTVRDGLGRTALHCVFYHSDRAATVAPCVSALLAGGADPNAKSLAGETPLHNAVLSGDVASIKLLIDAGADPNATAANGSSVLSYAVFFRKDPDIVRLLIAEGASASMLPSDGLRTDDIIKGVNVSEEIRRAINEGRCRSTP